MPGKMSTIIHCEVIADPSKPPRVHSTWNQWPIRGRFVDGVEALMTWALTEGHYILESHRGLERMRIYKDTDGLLQRNFMAMEFIPPWLSELTGVPAGDIVQV